jgi:hypothetical protein
MLHAVKDTARAEDLSKWCRYHERGKTSYDSMNLSFCKTSEGVGWVNSSID